MRKKIKYLPVCKIVKRLVRANVLFKMASYGKWIYEQNIIKKYKKNYKQKFRHSTVASRKVSFNINEQQEKIFYIKNRHLHNFHLTNKKIVKSSFHSESEIQLSPHSNLTKRPHKSTGQFQVTRTNGSNPKSQQQQSLPAVPAQKRQGPAVDPDADPRHSSN